METVYDWITVAIFVGLAVLFLQRSSEEEPRDKIYHYAPPAIGCAIANYLGNEGYMVGSVVLIVGILAYIHYILKPFAPFDSNAN
ncbi:XrtV sorting system accessory protein [Sphingopyxis sp. Geo48]|uniref:XrtV sorting system accessory protein n=1 Tax=Sphingopyxis sp. Geo48 TaxID=545241 RepID=UPI0024B845C1|nr:XrtV sorting system accessory protein [Sphingopyxis sp. Geo48]